MAALAGFAHDNGLLLHVDGARLANAAAALDLPLRAITTDVGVGYRSAGVSTTSVPSTTKPIESRATSVPLSRRRASIVTAPSATSLKAFDHALPS